MAKYIRFALPLLLLFLIQCAFPAHAAEVESTLRILFTNEIHGHAASSVGEIGLAELATYAQMVQADLLLDLGGLYHGIPFANLTQGESMADVIRTAGYRAMTIGSDDWNYGAQQLLSLEARSNVPILCANVVHAEISDAFFTNQTLVFMVQGIRVGLLGLIDPALYGEATPELLKGIAYDDPIPVARRLAKQLREEGCQVILCMFNTTNASYFARRIPEVDVFLTGSADLPADAPDKPFIAQTGSALENVGMLEIEYSWKLGIQQMTHTLLSVDRFSNIEPNAETALIITQVQEELQPRLDNIVGQTPEALIADKGETNLGRLVTDAYRFVTQADVAFEDAGRIKKTIPAGTITYNDVLTTLPYGNHLLTCLLNGEELLSVLEHSTEILIQTAGCCLQISGLTYRYNADYALGSRVYDIHINENPLDLNAAYIVAVSNFLASVDDYPEFRYAQILQEYEACDEALRLYILQFGVESALDVSRIVKD